jgi:hypothetical protein
MQRSQNENNPNFKNQQGAQNSMVEVDSGKINLLLPQTFSDYL